MTKNQKQQNVISRQNNVCQILQISEWSEIPLALAPGPLNDDTKILTETETLFISNLLIPIPILFSVTKFSEQKPILFSETKFSETEDLRKLAKVSRQRLTPRKILGGIYRKSYLKSINGPFSNYPQRQHQHQSKGRVALPNRRNFLKKFKRPSSPPLIFGKSYCNFFMTDMVAYMRVWWLDIMKCMHMISRDRFFGPHFPKPIPRLFYKTKFSEMESETIKN